MQKCREHAQLSGVQEFTGSETVPFEPSLHSCMGSGVSFLTILSQLLLCDGSLTRTCLPLSLMSALPLMLIVSSRVLKLSINPYYGAGLSYRGLSPNQ